MRLLQSWYTTPKGRIRSRFVKEISPFSGSLRGIYGEMTAYWDDSILKVELTRKEHSTGFW